MSMNLLGKLKTRISYLLRQPIRLSYGITVCSEADELERLLQFLVQRKDATDEIIVLQDITIVDEKVNQVLATYTGQLTWKQGRLDGDFAGFKNQLLDMASGTYLFQLDADEVPKVELIQKIKPILRKNHKADCFAIPRINRVEGITADFVEQYQWHLDDQNRINFPDYQVRLFKLNAGIHWRNKVHEEVVGYQELHYLPASNEEYCLLHVKDFERQKKQNRFYDSL